MDCFWAAVTRGTRCLPEPQVGRIRAARAQALSDFSRIAADADADAATQGARIAA